LVLATGDFKAHGINLIHDLAEFEHDSCGEGVMGVYCEKQHDYNTGRRCMLYWDFDGIFSSGICAQPPFMLECSTAHDE
jgi:hypothetical protein